jgi:hypothetical protein
MNISLYPVRSGRSPAGAITDCFKDVEWSMGVSGPRQGQGRVQGWQGGHSRRQTTPCQIAVAVSRNPDDISTAAAAALCSTAKLGSPVSHALHATLISSAPWPTEAKTIQAKSRQVNNSSKPWTERRPLIRPNRYLNERQGPGNKDLHLADLKSGEMGQRRDTT